MSQFASGFRTVNEWIEDALEEKYDRNLVSQYSRHGATTNRLIPFAEMGDVSVDSDGVNIRTEQAFVDNARASNQILGDFGTTSTYEISKIKYRIGNNPATNDFMKISVSAQVTDAEVRDDVKTIDLFDTAERVRRQIREDHNEKLAILRNCPRSGLLMSVSGTVRQNDKRHYNNASATATNATGARFKVTNGTIARVSKNTRIDIYNDDTLIAGNVLVDGVNPGDRSIGVVFDADSTGDLGGVATTHDIYFSGGKGEGMYSLEEFQREPAATGEPFIGGVDRATSAGEWLLFTKTREGEANASVTLDHLDDAGIAARLIDDDERVVVARTDLDIEKTLRRRLDSISMVQTPSAGSQRRISELGASKVRYLSPVWGWVVIHADPLMTPGRLDIINPMDWRSFRWGSQGLRVMPGDMGLGPWYRQTASDPNRGKGMFYRMDAYSVTGDWCDRARAQVTIENLTG